MNPIFWSIVLFVSFLVLGAFSNRFFRNRSLGLINLSFGIMLVLVLFVMFSADSDGLILVSRISFFMLGVFYAWLRFALYRADMD